VIAVRVLRDGVVVREEACRALPVRIGRGPENDVVLFDASVSRAHAVVEADEAGGLVVRDLGSRNGIHVGPRAVGEAHGARVRCFVGAVEVEVLLASPEDTLPLAAHDRGVFEHRRTAADHLRDGLLGLAAWLAMVVVDGDLWSPWQQNRLGTLLGHVIGAAVAIPFAAFVLLGVLRLAGRAVRIADTLRAGAVVLGALLAVQIVSRVLYYALPPAALGALGGALGALVAVWAVAYLAALRRRGRVLWFRLAWAAVTLVVVGGLAYTGSLAQRRAGMPDARHGVQPPVAGWTGPRRGLDDYLGAVAADTETAARSASEVRERHAAARRRNPVTATD
jgi:hypothetical protein